MKEKIFVHYDNELNLYEFTFYNIFLFFFFANANE